jgi:hypothetical protein
MTFEIQNEAELEPLMQAYISRVFSLTIRMAARLHRDVWHYGIMTSQAEVVAGIVHGTNHDTEDAPVAVTICALL